MCAAATGRYANKTGKYPYETSVIGNVSTAWIRSVATVAPPKRKPFMAYIGVKAPHVPSTPAPWYASHFSDPGLAQHYRTPNFNAHGAEHHWVVSQQPPLSSSQITEIDGLFRDRWRTLLSHDDLIAAVIRLVDELGMIERTFFFSTSDHGYAA